jgi:hypothetical protein
MSSVEWDKDKIKDLLKRNDRAVERAILAIWNRQTADEKEQKITKHKNDVGFTTYEATYGDYLARWIKAGKRVTGFHLIKARGMALRYSRQLLEIANSQG